MHCWRRSMAGSPRALTRPTCKRQRRCSRRWGDKTGGHTPTIHYAQICQETGKEQEVQVHYDEGLANHIGPEPCGGLREEADEKSVGARVGGVSRRESG